MNEETAHKIKQIKIAITAILLIPFLGVFFGVKLGSYPTYWFITSMAAIFMALYLMLWSASYSKLSEEQKSKRIDNISDLTAATGLILLIVCGGLSLAYILP